MGRTHSHSRIRMWPSVAARGAEPLPPGGEFAASGPRKPMSFFSRPRTPSIEVARHLLSLG